MPPSAGDQILDGLRTAAREVGCRELVDAEAAELAAFCRLFLKWNERINLASVAGAEELIGRHFIDAFAAARFVRAGDVVIDVGSGGGLPALPLAILSQGATFALHEPRTRRLAFLRAAVRELALGDRVTVSGQRIEIDGSPVRASGGASCEARAGGFSLAMSRATWPPADWLSLGHRLVGPSGRILVFTTETLAGGLPAPAASASYSRGRRLCMFEAAAWPP